MKLVYKPFEIVLGILAGVLGKRVFDALWARLDGNDPPRPTTQGAPVAKAVGAAALQAAVFAGTRAAVKRSGAAGWVRLTGTWPGDEPADPKTTA